MLEKYHNLNVISYLQKWHPFRGGLINLHPRSGDRAIVLEYNHEKEHKVFYEKLPCYVDSNFFDLFNYQFLRGGAHSALRQPNSAVMTADLARQLFGNADPGSPGLTGRQPAGGIKEWFRVSLNRFSRKISDHYC